MSTESIERVESDPDFTIKNVKASQDPLELWRIIKNTHVRGRTGIDMIDQVHVDEAYNSLRMRSGESLPEYKLRFDRAVRAREHANLTKIDEKRQTIDFILKADDSRFAEMKKDLHNSSILGQSSYPTNLADAMRVMSNYLGAKSSGNSQHHSATVFVSCATNISNGKKPICDKKKPHGAASSKSSKPEADANRNNNSNSSSSRNNSDNDKKKNQRKNQGCFLCNGDHFAKDCTELNFCREALNQKRAQVNITRTQLDQDDTASSSSTIFRSNFATTIKCFPVSDTNLSKFDLLIDSEAEDHIIHNKHFYYEGVHLSDKRVVFSGINDGNAVIATQCGRLFNAIDDVMYHPQARANILSWSKLRDNNPEIIRGHDDVLDEFYVQIPNKPKLVFKRKGGLYVCDMSKYFVKCEQFTTVAENESHFTSYEVAGARTAVEVQRRLGFMPPSSIIDIINAGAITNMPVTANDIKRSVMIHGDSVAMLKGRTKTKKAPSVRAAFDITPPVVSGLVTSAITLCCDIMFSFGMPFLLSVGLPIGLAVVSALPNKSAESIGKALTEQISTFSKFLFTVRRVRSDGEGGIMKCQSMFPDIEFIVAAAGAHDPTIERKIQTVKNIIRSVINSLPFMLAKCLLVWLVLYSVFICNLSLTKGGYMNISPREALTGRKVDYKSVLRAPFGAYAQVTVRNVNNSMAPRTVGAIALLPVGNESGSYKFWSLATGSVITSNTFTILPYTQDLIEYMKKLAEKPDQGLPNDMNFCWGGLNLNDDVRAPVSVSFPETHPMNLSANVPIEAVDSTSADVPDAPRQPPVVVGTTAQSLSVAGAEPETGVSVLSDIQPESGVKSVSSPDIGNFNYDESVSSNTADVNVVEEELKLPSSSSSSGSSSGYNLRSDRKYGSRDGGWDHRDSSVLFTEADKEPDKVSHAYHITLKRALSHKRRPTLLAAYKEIYQIVKKESFEPMPISKVDDKKFRKIIMSMMFMKEKYSPSGEFEKLKARLVAGGHMQDRSVYEVENITSPTVSTAAVFTIAAIAAREGRKVITMDIGGAYLHAKMEKDVYMKLDKICTVILCDIDPTYKEFVLPDGTCNVKLKKALYGCVESARLWYNRISEFLIKLGYEKNPVEECVFNKYDEDSVQCTVALYVDDLKAASKSDKLLEELYQSCLIEFKEVTKHEGKILPYLGMNFDYSEEGKVKVTMSGYIDDLMRYTNTCGTCTTPATDQLFNVREDSVKLDDARREEFHSIVAKCLYLSKRVRVDILLTVSFLTTRVLCPDEDDWNKLSRLLKYLNGSRNIGLCLEPGESKSLCAYIDASYGVHVDGKSHSGMCMSIGKGTFYARSCKQKIVSKSSSEAELIAASDMGTDAIHHNEFLIGQREEPGPADIKQDNQSTMAMISKGKSTAVRSRHVNIRYYWLKDRIDNGEVTITYLPTAEMVADVLTKPIQGEKFVHLRSLLLNWY